MGNNIENELKDAKPLLPLKAALLEGIDCMDQEELERLLELVEDSGVIIHQEPRLGLIMMTVRDCFDMPFHLGEVLVTTAEVEQEGRRGYGLLIGDEPEKALLLASVEAIELGDDWKLKGCLEGLITPLHEKAGVKRLRLMKIVGSTHVSFESMAQE